MWIIDAVGCDLFPLHYLKGIHGNASLVLYFKRDIRKWLFSQFSSLISSDQTLQVAELSMCSCCFFFFFLDSRKIKRGAIDISPTFSGRSVGCLSHLLTSITQVGNSAVT